MRAVYLQLCALLQKVDEGLGEVVGGDVDDECCVYLSGEVVDVYFMDGLDAECDVDGNEEVDFVVVGVGEDAVGEAEVVRWHFEGGEGLFVGLAVDGLFFGYFVLEVLYDFHGLRCLCGGKCSFDMFIMIR